VDSAQRKIVAAMLVTGLFALVGEYANPQPQTKPNPFRVILGGSVATAILVGMAELGDAGERFSVGLATIAVLSATLVYGGPVWKVLGTAVGGQGKGGQPTTPTGNTTPTTGTGTVQAITPAVVSAVAG
jgi:hypothetical protein